METDALVPANPLAITTKKAEASLVCHDESAPVDIEVGEKKDDTVTYGQRLREVFVATWSLGFTTFGDSSSQAAIIQDQVCIHRKWMDNETFMEIFALSRALPGPLATQLVMGTSIVHAGAIGGFLALLAFVIPGFIVLTGAGLLVEVMMDPEKPPIFLIGIPPATVALVFKAAYEFGSSLDKFGFGLAILSCTGAVLINGDYRIQQSDSQFIYPIMLAIGGVLTLVDATLVPTPIGSYSLASYTDAEVTKRIGIPVWAGAMVFQLWLIILLATVLLIAIATKEIPLLNLFEAFFRIGSMIFGGGEDVLAMMETQMVPRFVTKEQFFQGLGMSQAMPGPLFNFSAFIGAVYNDIPGAAVSTLGLFLPSFLFMLVGMSLWTRLRTIYWFKAVLKGVNAVAIGFIGAASIFLWENSVLKAADAIICIVSLGLCTFYNVAAPLVIIVAAVLGMIFEAANLAQVPYN